MNIILCTKNEDLLASWQETVTGAGHQVLSCGVGKSLADLVQEHKETIASEFVVLYHLLPDVNEEKALYTFLQAYPVADRMLVLANIPDTEQGIRLLHSGVHGYANARINSQKLLAAIEVVHQGEIWAGEEILMHLLQRHPNPSTGYRKDPHLNQILSNREKQIVDEVLQGKTNKQVAMSLNITERTVKAHLSAIFKKTGTRNRFELTVKLKAM